MMDLEAPLIGDVLAETSLATSTRVEASARFSPDGRRIAFASYRSGDQELWIAERDGSGLRQLTSLNAPQLVVSGWSPDGAQIVFDAAIGGNSDIYVVSADGGPVRRLTTEASIDGVPSWSRDGRWIYFSSTRASVLRMSGACRPAAAMPRASRTTAGSRRWNHPMDNTCTISPAFRTASGRISVAVDPTTGFRRT